MSERRQPVPETASETADIRLASSTFVVAAFLVAVRKTASWDVWWHLACGRATAAAGHVVDRDVFTYTFTGRPVLYQEVVTDLLWYVGFAALGFVFFAVVKLAAVLLVAWAMRRAQDPAQSSPLAWLAVTGLLLVAVESRFLERPLIVSQALLPLLLAQMDRARRAADADDSPRALARAFAPLTVIAWLWIQLHREALLAPVLLASMALFSAAAFVLRRWSALSPLWGRSPSGRTTVAWFACALATGVLDCANPCGVATLTTAIRLRSDPIFGMLIVEWGRVGVATLCAQSPVAAGLVVFALVFVPLRLVRAWRQRAAGERDRPPVDAWHFAIVLGLTYASLQAIRWVPIATTAAAIVDLLLVSEWAVRASAHGRVVARPLPILLAVGLCTWVGLHDPRPFGLGEARTMLPAGALAFAREHRLHERVTGSYELSGYVTWGTRGQTKVEMDGRLDALYPSSFALAVVRSAHEPEVFRSRRAKDGVDWVLASNRPGQVGYEFLAHDPGWMLVYLSEPAAIYVRRGAYPELAPFEFQVLDPGDPLGSIARAPPGAFSELEAEVARVGKESPDGRMTTAMTELLLRRVRQEHAP